MDPIRVTYLVTAIVAALTGIVMILTAIHFARWSGGFPPPLPPRSHYRFSPRVEGIIFFVVLGVTMFGSAWVAVSRALI